MPISVSALLASMKEIAGLVKKVGDLELYRKIVELEGDVIELTRTNRQLEEDLEATRRHADVIGRLKHAAPFYVDDADPVPFCQRCVEVDRRAVHMVKTNDLESRRRVWRCVACKTSVADTRPVAQIPPE